jgi:tRNA-Thr(GGU) m(6)t(6)A37 methyltransferase TsaA
MSADEQSPIPDRAKQPRGDGDEPPRAEGALDGAGQVQEPDRMQLHPVARVESSLRELADAPRQGDEGAPDAWVVFDESVRAALADVRPGDELILITWFDRADRSVLKVHPRSDLSRPPTGVFSTRSPDRPNPLGLHRVTVLAVEDLRLHVNNLEALDGTPIVDVKPVIGDVSDR